MDPIGSPIDTFSNTFSSEQLALLDNANLSPSAGHHDGTSPESNHAPSQGSHSPHSQNVNGGSTAAPGPRLNPRSCVTCRRRKVRCDKIEPCTNCQKAGIECVFPQPGRAPRRSKKPPDAELLARLRRLEGVVQKLGKGVDGEDISPGEKSPEASKNYTPTNGDSNAFKTTRCEPPSNHDLLTNGRNANFLWSIEEGKDTPADKLERFRQFSAYKSRESGRLVVGEGRSRYVSNSFWAGLTEEIAEMRDLLNYSSSGDEAQEDEAQPGGGPGDSNGGRLTHQEFIFGYSSTMLTLRILHPHSSQILTYWSLYKSNVDPVVRILHKPTTEQLFKQAAQDQSTLNKSSEALMFALYLSVITSLRPDECQSILKLDRDTALKRYRYATEQALSRAGFLATQEVIVVQAFTLFLTCARRQADNKAVWTLTGLLLRMGHSLGVHRDGVQFGLSPFDIEMRRRLWWQICTLDVRASEDQGSEPMVTDRFFDTKLPLNVNDSDIWPGMKDTPKEHEGCTEMTFDLVRYEIGGTIRLLSAMSKCPRESTASEHDQLEAKEAALERLRIRLEDKYLRHCDMSEPLQWVAANVSRLVMAKIWLVIHHPFRRGVLGSKVAQETRDRTFLTSIDVIRYARLLETQQRTMKWGWLFKSYFQWHAIAFLLAELCVRTSGPAVDDAWSVVDEAWPDWDKTSNSKKLALWKPVARLFNKAKAVRNKELEKRNMFPSDGSLGPAYQPKQANRRDPSMTNSSDTSSTIQNENTPDSQPGNTYPDNVSQMRQGSMVDSGDMMDVTQTNFPQQSFDNSNMLPAQPLTDMNTFAHSIDGINGFLEDPIMNVDPFLDTNMNWAGWDESMGMEFQNEIAQPMNFNVDQLWGGAS